MSFNYTPPPTEVIRMGQIGTGVLCAALLFVPKVRIGAIIGGLGSAAITYWVTSHASGDMGSLSSLIEPPIWLIIGGVMGAGISFISRSILRLVLRHSGPEINLPKNTGPDEQPPPIANPDGEKNPCV